MPLLMLAQKQNNNFLPLAAMHKIAKILEIPPMQVYEVASFYTMYNRTPVGKYHLQVCGTTPCMLRGAQTIIKTIEDHLDIKCGGTSKDGLFTLHEVECLGACVNAPMMQVSNEWFYEDLTPENTVALLDQMRQGSGFRTGPQISERVNSEGPEGRTCLQDFTSVPIDRDFAAEKERYETEKAEAAKK